MPTKRRIAKSICLFVLLLVFGCTAPPAVKVDVLPGFDALFDNRKGWTGADGAYSLSLSDDINLWLFGDTWLGDIRDGAHVNATIVNNTVAIQPLLCRQGPPGAFDCTERTDHLLRGQFD